MQVCWEVFWRGVQSFLASFGAHCAPGLGSPAELQLLLSDPGALTMLQQQMMPTG